MEKNNYNNSLAFAEYAQDVKHIIDKGYYYRNLKVIALGTEALLELKKRGIPCKCVDDFVEKGEFNNLINETLKGYRKLISLLFDCVGDLKDKEKIINSFEAHIWFLYAHIYIKSLCLKKIISTVLPAQVIYFEPSRQPLDTMLLLSSSESYFSNLMPDVLRLHFDKIKAIGLKAQIKPAILSSYWAYIKDGLLTIRDILEKKRSLSSNWVMILEVDREIQLFLDRTRINHFSWIFRNRLPINPFEGKIKRIKNLIINLFKYVKYRNYFKTCFDACKKNFHDKKIIPECFEFSLCERTLKSFFVDKMPVIKILSDESIRLFDIAEVKAIISNEGASHYSSIVLKAGKEKLVPRISSQHGFVPSPPNPWFEFVAMNNFSHYFAYGNEVLRNYDRKLATPKVVGSLWFEETLKDRRYLKKTKQDTLRFLYPLPFHANRFLHYNYLGGPHLLKSALKILDFISGYDRNDLRILVKTYSGNHRNLIKRYEKFKHIKFVSKGTVRDYVHCSDIMLLDFFSSSVIEGIAADMDIFVWNNCYLLSSEIKKSIEKRMFYTEDENIFFKALDNIIRRETPGIHGKDDQEFERGHCSPSRDGKNIDRYRNAFDEICRRHAK